MLHTTALRSGSRNITNYHRLGRPLNSLPSPKASFTIHGGKRCRLGFHLGARHFQRMMAAVSARMAPSCLDHEDSTTFFVEGPTKYAEALLSSPPGPSVCDNAVTSRIPSPRVAAKNASALGPAPFHGRLDTFPFFPDVRCGPEICSSPSEPNSSTMVEVVVSERERLDLVRQGDIMFLVVQERLYNAQTQRPQSDAKDRYVTTFDTFTIYGSLDDVTDLYLDADKKMVLDFSESRELAVLQPTTKKRPLDRMSLCWSLFHSPSRLLAKDQDFCYIEVMKPYGTQSGRRGWAKCAHSIKHDACPEFSDAQGIDVNRAELYYCGLFFEETEAVGVLNATVYYNIKRDNIPPMLLPIVLKARGKRNIELVNHYLRMSSTILNSKKHSLTIALQLQAEKRCGACTNQLSMWKHKDKCLLCGSFMCDKCDDIVARNYRVDRIARGQVVCFSCAARRGTKIALEGQNVDLGASDNSVSAVKTHNNSIQETAQEGDLREGSISSINDEDEFPKWFDEPAKPSIEDQSRPTPDRRHSQFTPHETVYLPSDHAAQQRRRTAARISTRRPKNGPDDDFITRRRSRTTGNSRLSSRAKPTGCAPSHPKESPTKMEAAAYEPVDFASVGSQVCLNLEEMNWRMRRFTTNSVPVELTDQGRRASAYHTLDGTRHHERLNRLSRAQPRPPSPLSPSTTARYSKPSSIRYSKTNPCDLSYLANFK